MEPPASVRQWFLDAGWHPGRAVDVPRSVPSNHPARKVLASFGGLVILEREMEPNENWPLIEELVFRALHPNPNITGVWGGLLHTQLVGIADLCNAHAELYIASDGRCFGASCVHDAFWFQGESFAVAVEGRLLGRRAQPMLRPNQPFVTMFGIRYTADSPEVYRY